MELIALPPYRAISHNKVRMGPPISVSRALGFPKQRERGDAYASPPPLLLNHLRSAPEFSVTQLSVSIEYSRVFTLISSLPTTARSEFQTPVKGDQTQETMLQSQSNQRPSIWGIGRYPPIIPRYVRKDPVEIRTHQNQLWEGTEVKASWIVSSIAPIALSQGSVIWFNTGTRIWDTDSGPAEFIINSTNTPLRGIEKARKTATRHILERRPKIRIFVHPLEFSRIKGSRTEKMGRPFRASIPWNLNLKRLRKARYRGWLTTAADKLAAKIAFWEVGMFDFKPRSNMLRIKIDIIL